MQKNAELPQLRSLRQHYTIVDENPDVMHLLDGDPSLDQLLCEAVSPLRQAFGETRPFHLRLQHSEDDTLLKVAVQLPPDFSGDAECLLRSFDTAWWLSQCHRSGGAVVFDYEIQDAV